MQDLLIAIDPGFDSMKVVANGRVFKFPFNVVETDERKMTDYRLRDDFMLYQGEDGATYRVGQYAREMSFDNKADVASFYTEKRFISKEFLTFMLWWHCPMPVGILMLPLSLAPQPVPIPSL